MVSTRSLLTTLAVLLSATTAAALPSYFPRVTVSQDHYEVLSMRANTAVNPSAVLATTCLDSKK